jgi:hypothetical protein
LMDDPLYVRMYPSLLAWLNPLFNFLSNGC